MSKFAYVGTYNSPNGKVNGIYIYQVDPSTGSMKFLETVETESASFLCFNRKRDRLYVVNELNRHEGQNGEITSFKVATNTGKLSLLNKVSSLGIWPCHLCLDPSEKYVLAANYGSGSVAIYSLKPDGCIDKNTDLLINQGSGPNADRQKSAHAHMITFDNNGKKAMLVDLGLDQTLFYNFDSSTGKLVRQPGQLEAKPGAGARHVVESQDSLFYYVINELDGTINVFSALQAADGKFPVLQTVSTLPTGVKFEESFLCAEIMLHPNGKFLYGSNRGHDTIVVFAVDAATGLLSVVEHVPTLGSFPRHFQIHPNGNFMFVANQKSDNIVTFQIDSNNGKLTLTGGIINVPAPVCIMFN